MAFIPDGIAPPGIPILGCSPPHHDEVQNGLWRFFYIVLCIYYHLPFLHDGFSLPDIGPSWAYRSPLRQLRVSALFLFTFIYLCLPLFLFPISFSFMIVLASIHFP